MQAYCLLFTKFVKSQSSIFDGGRLVFFVAFFSTSSSVVTTRPIRRSDGIFSMSVRKPSAGRENRFDSKGWWQALSCPKREEAAERKRGRAGKEDRTRPLVPPRT